MADQHIQFPTTDWSAVGDAAGSKHSLERLLERYCRPMLAHLTLDQRLPSHDAEDLLQGFVVAKILAGSLLATAEKEQGRFRNLVLKALDRYVIDEWRKQQAQRRAADRAQSLEPSTPVEDTAPRPHAAFDLAWAWEVLSATLDRMRESCRSSNRPHLWAVFEARVLLSLAGETAPDYEELAVRLRLEHAKQAANAYTTAQRMFARLLREQLTQLGEADLEDGVSEVLRILASAGAELSEKVRSYCGDGNRGASELE